MWWRLQGTLLARLRGGGCRAEPGRSRPTWQHLPPGMRRHLCSPSTDMTNGLGRWPRSAVAYVKACMTDGDPSGLRAGWLNSASVRPPLGRVGR